LNNRLQKALEGLPSDRVPFIPAIYEHKAWFVQETPSTVCRDPELLHKAVLAEYECVRPDALVVGLDVYNVEAEAVGSRVTYFEGSDTSVPAISSEGTALKLGMKLSSLRIPNPHTSGRMRINLDVARRLKKILGLEVPIRGALSGPFSLATNLVGAEEFFLMLVDQPELASDILRFSASVITEYGGAYIEEGCGVILFDSQASPELLSPKMYRDFVLPITRGIVRHFQAKGIKHVPLIIGGDTTRMLDEYLATGANNILCDSRADFSRFLHGCSRSRLAVRRNIDSSNFLTARPEELHQVALRYLEEARGYPGFILGTSVVPYGTPIENLLAIRDAAWMHQAQPSQSKVT
jgi:uroporphyrinogen decarboxylase